MTAEDEVTPAMMDAGLEAFYSRDSRFEDDGDVVRRIYLAMALRREPADDD